MARKSIKLMSVENITDEQWESFYTFYRKSLNIDKPMGVTIDYLPLEDVKKWVKEYGIPGVNMLTVGWDTSGLILNKENKKTLGTFTTDFRYTFGIQL